MMLKKVYLEIGNVCNRSCAFCPGTSRKAKQMSVSEFRHAAEQVKTVSDFVYFHLMGEPLLHPYLSSFLQICDEIGLKVIITTNGTLLSKCEELLLGAKALHKVNISLHSFEANTKQEDEAYFTDCFSFAKSASEKGKIVVLRLWNQDGILPGMNSQNESILNMMKVQIGGEWTENTRGFRIAPKLFLEWGERFTWPDLNLPILCENGTCYGLRDQVGILSDGSVVPCCLDKNADIYLGNIFKTPLSEILSSKRATAIRDGFLQNRYTELLCKTCGYAIRFSTKNK
jgi:radical SAM protein with 4Fe4S-binding SPASM domain